MGVDKRPTVCLLTFAISFVLSTFVAISAFSLLLDGFLTVRIWVGIPPMDIVIPGFGVRSPDLFPFNCIFAQ